MWSARILNSTRTIFPVRYKSCFILLLFPKLHHFDTVLLLVYMVAKLVYPKCTQDKILPKVVTCHNFLEKTMLSQFATQCVANSQLPLHHNHLGHNLVHPKHDSKQDVFLSPIRSSEMSELS